MKWRFIDMGAAGLVRKGNQRSSRHTQIIHNLGVSLEGYVMFWNRGHVLL